ncbi:MAG: helix-turn-helix transcriptional regulator [Bordetella sp.]|uniref:helix-turn-helix transcriptional regulator n=1 Tax=Bordetella sp. TaxID=28081 RepID=UPI003F7B6FCA
MGAQVSIDPMLLDDIYAAALGEQSWESALGKIRVLLGQRSATLLTLDHVSLASEINAVVGDDAAWVGEVSQAYNTEFYRYDPIAEALTPDWKPGAWFEDAQLLTRQQKSRHVFYQDFMRPYGLGSISGMFIDRSEHSSAFLSVQGGPESGGLSEAQRRQIQAVYPHVRRALRMQMRLREQETRAAIAESALAAMTAPVFILNDMRRLLWANGAAEALLSREPALRFVQGRFVAAGCADDAQWQAACRQGGLLLRRADGAPLPLTLFPIAQQSRLMRAWHGRLFMMTAADPRKPEGQAKRLQCLFGLTPSEAELTLLICNDGLSPQECADLRGVALSTVRSQIKAIYTKTGATRTAQLAALVMQT